MTSRQVIIGLFPDDLVKRPAPVCPDVGDALLDLLQRLFGERFRVRHIPEAVQRLVVGLLVKSRSTADTIGDTNCW